MHCCPACLAIASQGKLGKEIARISKEQCVFLCHATLVRSRPAASSNCVVSVRRRPTDRPTGVRTVRRRPVRQF